MGIGKKIYKKLLFLFFSFGENIVYRNKKTSFIAIAEFIKQGLIKNFQTNPENIILIPSGVNLKEFNFSKQDSSETQSYLKEKYPVLKALDTHRPIALFVGAYERKGLDRALEALKGKKDYQFIIIGKPEQASTIEIEKKPNHFFISFTKEVNLFYELADIFIFPTRYEPFGLVIIEAYVMGLDLVIPKDNVGASEIIPDSEGIYFFHQNEKIVIPDMAKLSLESKIKRRNLRMKNIVEYSWKNAGEKFHSILFKNW